MSESAESRKRESSEALAEKLMELADYCADQMDAAVERGADDDSVLWQDRAVTAFAASSIIRRRP